MLCNIENLHVGQWVAVDQLRSDCNCPACKPRGGFTGNPQQIKAISVPWIVVESLDGSIDTLDLRYFSVRKLHRTYVRYLRSHATGDTAKTHQPATDGHVACVPQAEDDNPPVCGWCGEDMRETTIAGEWQCPECHRVRRLDT